MSTEEPTIEVLIEPVAILRHHHPMTKTGMVAATLLPRIQAEENLSCMLFAYSHL